MVCRVACPLLPGFPPPLLSSIYTLSALQVPVMVPSGSLLRYLVKSSRWGHPYWVVWRISAHSIGTKASSVHLSLVASQWGHPTGRVWFFSHSIETKSSLDIWSVFLQDGVTLFGSESNVLISSEGITTVGLLGAFFRPVLGVGFCHPLVGRSALKRGGFHIQLSSLLARTLWVSL